MALMLGGATLALAEPVLDRAVSSATVKDWKGCADVRIAFNFRIRYVSHFPVGGGREVRIKVAPLDPNIAAADIGVKRQALRAPAEPGAAIKAIEFEVNGSGPVLHVLFGEAVRYRVLQGGDFTSIRIVVAGGRAPKRCRRALTALGEEAVTARKGKSDALTVGKNKSTARKHGADPKSLLRRAKRAFALKDYEQAVRLLTKLLSGGGGKYAQTAQELLGVARERQGRLAHAKAEYRIYLRKYPTGAGAVRVRQRLAGIETAQSRPKSRLQQGKAKSPKTAKPRSRQKSTLAEKGSARARKQALNSTLSGKGNRADARPRDPDAWRWDAAGSISQFYFRNQGFRTFTELQSRRKTSDDEVYQNSLLSAVDGTFRAENAQLKVAARFAGSHNGDFTGNSTGKREFAVSTAYGEAEHKPTEVYVRLGRQSRNTGGVLGRFDGALASWQASGMFRLNATAGSPVDSSRDEPFLYDRYFYGLSLDIGPFMEGWNSTVFFVDQEAGSFTDRRALGMEFRYFDADRSLFGTIDYDVFFDRLSSAVISGTWTFPDRSTLTLGFDYLHSPTLMTTNALQGQSVDTLDQLKALFTSAQIKELALDRTFESTSGTISYSSPINEFLQFNADATVFHTYGTPASGGVAAVEAPGTEWFLSAQLIGSGIFTQGDIYLLGLRYANTASSDLYLLDMYARYPFMERKLRLRPRLRAGYRDLKSTAGEEYFLMPSLTANYYVMKDLSLELDIGTKWTTRSRTSSNEDEIEFFITVGYRYDLRGAGKI